MPFAVVESSLTHLSVARRTVVISPHVVPASLDFALHGVAAKIEGPRQEQGKVQNAHSHRSEEQLSQKPVQLSAPGVLLNGMQDVPGRLDLEAVRHCSIVCAINRLLKESCLLIRSFWNRKTAIPGNRSAKRARKPARLWTIRAEEHLIK